MDVRLEDFLLFSEYITDPHGPRWAGGDDMNRQPCYIIDTATGRKYWNQSHSNIRIKCLLLAFGGPVAQISFLAMKFFARISDVFVTLIAPEKDSYSWQAREVVIQLTKAFAIPFIYVALELAAIYGLFSPLDGRRIYGSLERLAGDERYLAPCFQPDPTRHFFGGAADDPNAF